MRIVYCVLETCVPGGIERVEVGKANWLAAHGHEVAIVTTEQDGESDYFPLHEKVKRIDLDIMFSETIHRSLISRFFLKIQKLRLYRKKLKNFLSDFRPDITISTFGDEKMFLSKFKDGSKKIAELHTSRLHYIQKNRKGIEGWIDKVRMRRDIKYASRFDKFIVLTKGEMNNWKGLQNIEDIPNFVTITPPKQPSDLSKKSVIAVGRLVYEKGFEQMIAAWNIVHTHTSDWKLHIYGAGPLRSQLQNEIESRHLESVIKIHEPESDIVSRYVENSAYLMSSRWEGFGLVLTEAMACGLPLISYSCPCGPRDLIQDGYNGMLVHEGDIEGLANAIIRVIEDEELRLSMGRNALEESKKYLQDNIMTRWEDLFRQIVDKR